MCSKPKFIEDAQRSVDAAIDSVQSQTQAAVDQATGNTSSSSGGKGAPVTTPVFNIPSFGGIGGGFEVPEINIPTPNFDQDLTKVNTQTVQNAVVDAGSAIQEQVVQSGAAGQQALIDAASATQTNVINTGAILSNNQSNPTLEAAANTVTSNTESIIAEATKYVENKLVPTIRGVTGDIESITPRIEQVGMMLNPGTAEGNPAAAQPPSADLDAKDFEGNEDPFGNIEKSTTKADKLTEEERLRRIRRLMLNRYGREDTILTGAKDPFNRRRYARSL